MTDPTPQAGAMDSGVLLELAGRCERASEGCPELDVLIGGQMFIEGWHVADSMRTFTRSLDAARTLVPEGWAWTLDGGDPSCNDSASLGPIPASGQIMNPTIIADAATPALALCAAALRARAATAPSS